MADHYRAALEALQDVNSYCDQLDELEEYDNQRSDPDPLSDEALNNAETRRRVAAKLEVSLGLAQVHATLAQAQALQERALVR